MIRSGFCESCPAGSMSSSWPKYDAAVTSARRPEHYHALHQLLHPWRLRAAACADPGFADRLEAVQDAVRSGRREGTPIEEAVPGWAARGSLLAAA